MTHSICTRSIAAVVALSFAALAVPHASAQTTATTVPVGFITKTIPAGPDAATPSNTVLSIPLYQTADFQSSVAITPAAGSSDIKLTSATFSAGQFTGTPHLVRVKSGALVGKFWLITTPQNAGDTVTVVEPNGGAPGNLTGLLANDSCEILPANTFGSTFGLIPGLGTSAANSGAGAGVDNILVWNGTNYDLYYYKQTAVPPVSRWQKSFGDATNTIILPDDALFFVRKVASPLPVTLMGTVPSTTERTELTGQSNNFVSNRFPVNLTLATSQIETTPGWVKATTNSANGVDQVLLWNGASFDVYYYKQTAVPPVSRWQKGFGDASAISIPAADGMFISRVAGTSDAVLTQNLPYTP